MLAGDSSSGRNTSCDWLRLWRQVLRDAWARFGGLPDLEDLVQDAFLLLVQQEAPIENPRAWLRATVWRLCANRYRTTRSRDETPVPRGVSRSVEGVELQLDFEAIARRLTPHERRLMSHLARGLSHREIARELGVGWKSVGARVQRLRHKLRPLLLADAGTPSPDARR